MKFSNLKITGFLTIIFAMFLYSCKNDEFKLDLLTEEEEVFQFKTENTYCKSDPKKEIRSKSFKYNNGNLTETTSFHNENPNSKTTTFFNVNSQPLKDSTFHFSENQWTIVNTIEYVYSRNLLLEEKRFVADGTNTHKTVYKYSGIKPKWEEFYYYKNDQWQFQYAHRFEFDRDGKLTKKSSYQTVEKDKVYDSFIYSYKGGKLFEEKRIIRTGETSYIKNFTYTSEGFPDETIQDGNVIKKNFYANGKLTEKHTFYFGIDPGFSICNGNLIYRYSY